MKTRVTVEIPKLSQGSRVQDVIGERINYTDMHGSARTVRLSFVNDKKEYRELPDDGSVPHNGKYIVNSKQLMDIIKVHKTVRVNVLNLGAIELVKDHILVSHIGRGLITSGILINIVGNSVIIDNPEWIGEA